jgi:hypothetical protein
MDNLYRHNARKGNGPVKGSVIGPSRLHTTGVTLVHPFYGEQARFENQYKLWLDWPDSVKRLVNIVLIDDGASNPIHTWITPSKLKRINDLNLTVYRITQDLKWNTPGALNLGFTVAPDPWVLIMDSDCAFDGKNWQKLLDQKPVEEATYQFPRQRIGDKTEDTDNRRYLPCTILIHKNTVWKMGGFDEDFTGEYTGGYAFFDSDLFLRFKEESVPNYIWNGITATEWMPSQSNGEIVQRTQREERLNRQIMYRKQRQRAGTEEGSPRNTQILRFPWKRTFRSVRGEGCEFS